MDLCNELKDMISMAVCGLCDKPEMVNVTAKSIDPKNIFISVYCNKEDIRLLVGRNGQNISALRTIATAISAKNQFRMTLVIDE